MTSPSGSCPCRGGLDWVRLESSSFAECRHAFSTLSSPVSFVGDTFSSTKAKLDPFVANLVRFAVLMLAFVSIPSVGVMTVSPSVGLEFPGKVPSDVVATALPTAGLEFPGEVPSDISSGNFPMLAY